jgi:hypothetical protein
MERRRGGKVEEEGKLYFAKNRGLNEGLRFWAAGEGEQI